tara:strand:- start:154 stop:315 length:162 start_codon:yes stop_codon:yes gene_type:complete
MTDFKALAKKLNMTETTLIAKVCARIKINQQQEEARKIFKNRKDRSPVKIKKL